MTATTRTDVMKSTILLLSILFLGAPAARGQDAGEEAAAMEAEADRGDVPHLVRDEGEPEGSVPEVTDGAGEIEDGLERADRNDIDDTGTGTRSTATHMVESPWLLGLPSHGGGAPVEDGAPVEHGAPGEPGVLGHPGDPSAPGAPMDLQAPEFQPVAAEFGPVVAMAAAVGVQGFAAAGQELTDAQILAGVCSISRTWGARNVFPDAIQINKQFVRAAIAVRDHMSDEVTSYVRSVGLSVMEALGGKGLAALGKAGRIAAAALGGAQKAQEAFDALVKSYAASGLRVVATQADKNGIQVNGIITYDPATAAVVATYITNDANKLTLLTFRYDAKPDGFPRRDPAVQVRELRIGR